MDQDLSELIQYLDGKFSGINGELLSLHNQLSIIRENLDKKTDKEDFNNLQISVDSYAKKADGYFQEMLALGQKIDRHEKWLHQVADKLGIKLEY